VVENQPGAGGNIATDYVVRAEPDGYSLLMPVSTNAVNVALYRNLSFDFQRDIAPIAGIAKTAFVIITPSSFPTNDLKEFVAYLKANPGKVNMASGGIGTTPHMCGELFQIQTGTKMVHVPYRGGGAAATPDLLKGRISMMMNNPAILLQYVREKKLKAIGVTGLQRLEILPEVPTIAESGLPGYDMTGAQGMFAPAGTPKEIVLLLNDRIQKILQEPEVKKKWLTVGQGVPSPHKPEYYTAELHRKYEMYEQLIKATGVKLE
jgi:tripartite-type tricarboxylate transporter receptor subunit TctC